MPPVQAPIAPPEVTGRRALAQRVKALGSRAGFHLVRVTTAEPLEAAEQAIVERVRSGLMDGLPWYNEARARRGCQPTAILPQARSIIALGLNYFTPDPPEPADGRLRGRVSRYAWGEDYHKVVERRVKEFIAALRELGATAARSYVDYGPMPDRAVAQRAGMGWYGKNTNLLAPGVGSWVFLAEVLTDLDLEPDRPLRKSCGTCTTCIPACPTNAIPAPYVIDNRRCISYHTIENRGPIPREIRPLMRDWVFGCDICQDVCPVNERTSPPGDAAFAARSADDARPDLQAILSMAEEQFRRRYQGSPVRRAGYAGLQRNACIALGNLGDRAAVPALATALRGAAPLVRGHAAWALGRLGGPEASAALSAALREEAGAWVREEITLALEACGAQ